MLVIDKITLDFGARRLYDDASWHIKPGQKIGLIGPNGSGKSTLLRMIAGEFTPTSGAVRKRKDVRTGFLNQDLLSYTSDENIVEVACEAFPRAKWLHHEVDVLLEKMQYDHSTELIDLLHDYQHELEITDAYDIHYKAEQALAGLGFSPDDMKRSYTEFSGGWRMRVMLAKILLEQPHLLLLDEPTNHLDLPSIKWVEQYIRDYEGTVIIVSHDRNLLDNIANIIVLITEQKFKIFHGNYSDFEIQLEAEKEMQQSRFENQQDYIRQQQALIDRFRAKASKARMAQSKMKALDKLDRITEPTAALAKMGFDFTFSVNPGKTIMELKHLSKSYPGVEIFNHTHAAVQRGDKIALIGANGGGKSTLLRIIAGTETFTGERIVGHQVISSFYAQHQVEVLNGDNDLMQELLPFTPKMNETFLRSVLGAFLFSGDDVFKKIKVLSGGEKSRVALAKSMLAEANFLMLDEPTNHLDIASVGVLINVLQRYEGTFVVVSHDRYFLSQVANKIWYIENHNIKEYPGTYDQYEEWRLARADKKAADKKAADKLAKSASATGGDSKATRMKDREEHEKKKKNQSKLKKALQESENKIETLAKEKAKLEEILSHPDSVKDPKSFRELSQKFTDLESSLIKENENWEKIFNEIAELESMA